MIKRFVSAAADVFWFGAFGVCLFASFAVPIAHAKIRDTLRGGAR